MRCRPLLAVAWVVAACSGPREVATEVPAGAAPAPPRPPLVVTVIPPASERPTFAAIEREHHAALLRDARDRVALEGLARLYYDRGLGTERGYLLLADRVVDQAERALATIGVVSAEILVIRGLLAHARQRPDHAAAAFRAALRADPGHAAAALELARIELRIGDPAAALAHLEIAAADPSLTLEVRLGEGVAHLARGDAAAAEAALLAARRLAPADPRPHFNLGIVALREAAAADGLDRRVLVLRATGHLEDFLRLAGDDPALADRVAAARLRLDALAAERPTDPPGPTRAREVVPGEIRWRGERERERERLRVLELEAEAEAEVDRRSPIKGR